MTALTQTTLVTRADMIVIGTVLLMLPLLFLSFWGDGSQGITARIQVAGQTPLLIPLHRTQQYTIKGPLGISVIKVQDGRIRFLESPCRNQHCIHSGWLQRDAEFAACLPNLISITIAGRNPRFDSINF